MRPLLAEDSFVHDIDAVSISDGGESMSYDDCCNSMFFKVSEGLLDLFFVLSIKSRCSLIKDQHLWLLA